MPRISFIEHDGTQHDIAVKAGLTVMEAARDNGVPGIEAECGGVCSCATCHVFIDPEWLSATGEAEGVERDMLGLIDDYAVNSRLSCQVALSDGLDGLVVRLPKSQGF